MKPTNNEIREQGLVLKGIDFKPLINIKTNNEFSYTYAVLERNSSVNSKGNIRWQDGNTPEKAKKIKILRAEHEVLVELHKELKLAVKDEDKRAQRSIKKEIEIQKAVINEVLHPESEREYVESREAKRMRLAQANELKLDAGTIQALTGKAPEDGVAKAKLEEAQKRIAELEALAKGTQTPVEQSPAEISADEAVEDDSADANNPWD